VRSLRQRIFHRKRELDFHRAAMASAGSPEQNEADMEELIARIAAASGAEPDVARKAVGMILDFLRKEGPKAEVDELFASVPGAAEVAAENAGGALNDLVGALGGGLMGLAGRLSSLGLGMGEMQAVGKEVFAFVREKAGDERVGQVVAAIPGLGQFL
jgi:hypothetical protein